jgi:hypothetical protein
MKSMQDLLGESRERAKARFADRKEIEATSFSVRCEARRANEDLGQEAMAAVTFEALSTADRAIHKVDGVMAHLEYLRLWLIQIATGERWHQTERPPQMDDLARDLGELAALLQVREVLTRKDAAR